MASGRNYLTGGPKPLERLSFRQRSQDGYRSPPIRHLDGFTRFNATQEFAGALTEFTHPYRCHVLFVAL